jgi:hypothetical protein
MNTYLLSNTTICWQLTGRQQLIQAVHWIQTGSRFLLLLVLLLLHPMCNCGWIKHMAAQLSKARGIGAVLLRGNDTTRPGGMWAVLLGRSNDTTRPGGMWAVLLG